MTLFYYEGMTRTGDKVSGQFTGTREGLVKSLQLKSIILTAIKEESKRLRKGKYSFSDFKSNIENLHYLISSGMQLDKAVSFMKKNSRKLSVIEFWEEVLKNLKQGLQLSMALKKTSEKIGYKIEGFYSNIISVGEEVGDLKNSLKNLLRHLEFKESLIKDVKSAISYPVFLIVMSILTIIFVAGFILPKLSGIFSEKEIERLPSISRLTLSFGSYLNENFLFFIVGFLLIVVGIFAAFRVPHFLRVIKYTLYKVPYLRDLVLKFELSNLFSAIGIMLNGGVNLSKAIRLSIKGVGHKNLKNLLEETNQELKKGHRISEVWSKYEIIPEDVVSIIAVGENSAKLGEIYLSLGEKSIKDFKISVSRALSLLEPSIIVVLGFFIAFIVVSIMLAVIGMSDIYG